MPARRKSTRKIKEVLRLRNELKLEQRQIARSCSLSVSTVHEYLKRAAAANIGWPLPDGWDDARLAAALFPPSAAAPQPPTRKSPPDFAAIHQQLQHHRHLTLQLVWEEYRQANPGGYRYSWFCERYQHWRRHLDVVLRQEHKAGEKIFVDWAGATIPIYDREHGASLAGIVVCFRAGRQFLHLRRSDSRSADGGLVAGAHPRAGVLRRGADFWWFPITPRRPSPEPAATIRI